MRKPGSGPPRELERLASEPLLTEEQRAALDVALAKKAVEREERTINGVPPELGSGDLITASSYKSRHGKQSHVPETKTKRALAHDHHLTRRGSRGGNVKKGGSGGRFNWGTAMDPEEYEETSFRVAADRGDPNYDSEDDEVLASSVTFAEERSTQIAAYKAAVAGLLHEYFASGDLKEAAVTLEELDHPEFGHYFVKKAVTTALDHHDREREMTSVLLSTLYNEVLTTEDMRKGFVDLINSLDDLTLDVPDAADLVALFACRAVADDALPPAFLLRIEGEPGSMAASFRHKCESHLNDKHFAERMDRAWGHGAGFKLEETKESIRAMLDEYLASAGDVGEVRRLLRDLSVPFFHHELVKQALIKGLEDEARLENVLSLLRQLSSSGDVSVSQMTKGYQRIADGLSDIQLDCPSAPKLFEKAAKVAMEEDWIEKGWTSNPTSSSAPSTPIAARPATAPEAAANGLVNFDADGNPIANGRGPWHPSVRGFKTASLDIIREYFDSGDAVEVAQRLQELDEPGFMNIFVKQAVQLALDRKDREREMVSALLPTLTPSIIAPDQMSLGFTRLLSGADDLALDVPDAAHLLALFLGRAIVDEVLPPKFLAEVVPALTAEGLGIGVVQAAGGMLSVRHAAERFATAWHRQDAMVEGDANVLSNSIEKIVKEYLSSRDEKEAAQCLRDLDAPHFHHEFVVQAIVAALGEPTEAGESVMRLLRHLSESGEISQTQLVKGFQRLRENVEDLRLDFTKAEETIDAWGARARSEGWMDD